MELFNRDGKLFTGTPEINEKGKPYTQVNIPCDRCHVIGGQRLWIMGIENNRPWSKTGFDCWTCGNTGVRKVVDDRLYTAEELAKLNASAEKRAAKRFAAEQAEAARKAAERVTAEAAYRAANADFLAKLATLCTNDGSAFWDRLAGDMLAMLKTPTARQIELVEGEVAKRAKNAASAFLGAVGDKIEMTITIERVINIGDRWMPCYISICRDSNGNVVTYKGTAAVMLDTDGEFKVRATVKEHTVYNGVNQTVIQRPKLLDSVI
jgi:hypothetical protein